MATCVLRNPQATTALTENQFASRWKYSVASSAALTEPKDQEFTFSAPAGSYRVWVRDFASSASTNTPPAWMMPTISALDGIQSLPENWDSYGGKPINRDLILQSLDTLARIMKADSPAPSIVPIGDGGIQIEWHRKQQDLEIVFPVDDTPQFYYRNKSTATAGEGPVSDTKKLIHLLMDLA